MEKIPPWYVITGGPGSGKSTTIDFLSKKGYYTVPEYARFFIDGELKKGKVLDEIKGNPKKFQDKVSKLKIRMEEGLPKNKVVFLDRGLPDSIAYYRFWNIEPPEAILEISRNRYRKVFFLEMLPYKKDYARNETEKEALTLEGFIKNVYDQLGYSVVKVPVASVEDRIKLILSRIKPGGHKP